jgi:hypothetical protein
VFLIDSPAPETFPITLQRLWFADSGKWITVDFTDKEFDAINTFWIAIKPFVSIR